MKNFFEINHINNYFENNDKDMKRNLLKKEYDKYLYNNNQSLNYNKEDLFSYAKELKAIQREERMRDRRAHDNYMRHMIEICN